MFHALPARRLRTGLMLAGALSAVPVLLASNVAAASPTINHHGSKTAVTATNLVSDVPGRAPLIDPALVNPWGLALSPTSPLWAADNGSDSATLYAGGRGGATPTKVPLDVPIAGGAPTGTVFNDTDQFVVKGSGGSAPARFIFSSEAGLITAWDPGATPNGAVPVARVRGAIFKSLALWHTRFGPILLAADFHHGKILAFNRKFHQIHLPKGAFTDRRVPKGFSPFNIAVLHNSVYVTYAKQDADREDDVAGRGLGFVDRFFAFGLLHQRVASRGTLNAPWGLTIAPPGFGRLTGKLLVGNFGDGRISVFDRHTNHFRGVLRDSNHKPISIEGLWALLPGTATTGGTNVIWFSAGPDDESHGLLGQLSVR